MKISKDITIKAILDIKPDAHKILHDFGLGCAHCELGSVETLEEGARGHGLNDEEIGELVEKIKAL